MESINQISVLIIEDDEVNRMILNVLFQKTMNIEKVVEWSNSFQFLERLQELSPKPDLIIMDIMIAPFDGYEMIQKIRELPEFDDIKIVAHTASVMRDQVQEMKAHRFDGLISKPITRELFPQLINRIMQDESIWYIS